MSQSCAPRLATGMVTLTLRDICTSSPACAPGKQVYIPARSRVRIVEVSKFRDSSGEDTECIKLYDLDLAAHYQPVPLAEFLAATGLSREDIYTTRWVDGIHRSDRSGAVLHSLGELQQLMCLSEEAPSGAACPIIAAGSELELLEPLPPPYTHLAKAGDRLLVLALCGDFCKVKHLGIKTPFFIHREDIAQAVTG